MLFAHDTSEFKRERYIYFFVNFIKFEEKLLNKENRKFSPYFEREGRNQIRVKFSIADPNLSKPKFNLLL